MSVRGMFPYMVYRALAMMVSLEDREVLGVLVFLDDHHNQLQVVQKGPAVQVDL